MLQTFLRESREFMQEVDKHFSVLWEKSLSLEQRLHFLWHSIWT